MTFSINPNQASGLQQIPEPGVSFSINPNQANGLQHIPEPGV